MVIEVIDFSIITRKLDNTKKLNIMFENIQNSFNGMFGKIAPGMCRLTMNGNIAVKCNNGYKSYNIKKGTLTNVTNFCFNVGDEMFFVIPTNKVEVGDIILVGGKPKCVTSADKKIITVIDYENSEVRQVVPERHVFMGNTYFYGKIVSMFGDAMKGKKGMNKMMSYMMMSEMMKGNGNGFNNSNNNSMSAMLPFMMMNGNGFGNMFDGLFDDEEDEKQEDEK